MDPSTPQAQNTPTQQTISRIQPPALVSQPGGNPTNDIPQGMQPVSGPKEQGPMQSASVQEMPQDTEDQVAPVKQEAGISSTSQQKEEQKIEVKQSVPEVALEQSIENVVEKSADIEKPNITEELKQVGVTHSGPGIPVDENKFAVHSLPMTYQQAAVIDKQTSLKESKHWLSELIMYIWKKIDPNIAKKGVEK